MTDMIQIENCCDARCTAKPAALIQEPGMSAHQFSPTKSDYKFFSRGAADSVLCFIVRSNAKLREVTSKQFRGSGRESAPHKILKFRADLRRLLHGSRGRSPSRLSGF